MPEDKIAVLIVEDHSYTAEGVRLALQREPDIEIVAVAASAAEGLSLAMSLNPDVVMLDLHLPDSPPVRDLLNLFCTEVRWKVIVFSAEDRAAFIEAVIKSDAAGYLSKGEPPEKVAAAIRAVPRLDGRIMSKGLPRSNARISPALEEILCLLAKGMKYQEIAELREVNSDTVRRQCELLQIRLGLNSREQLISWAVLNGYASVD